jgi:hypothetical protein
LAADPKARQLRWLRLTAMATASSAPASGKNGAGPRCWTRRPAKNTDTGNTSMAASSNTAISWSSTAGGAQRWKAVIRMMVPKPLSTPKASNAAAAGIVPPPVGDEAGGRQARDGMARGKHDRCVSMFRSARPGAGARASRCGGLLPVGVQAWQACGGCFAALLRGETRVWAERNSGGPDGQRRDHGARREAALRLGWRGRYPSWPLSLRGLGYWAEPAARLASPSSTRLPRSSATPSSVRPFHRRKIITHFRRQPLYRIPLRGTSG